MGIFMSQPPLNIFLAAVYTNSYIGSNNPNEIDGNRYPKLNREERVVIDRVKHHNILESYHYVHRKTFVDYMRSHKAKIFLDSGAFSAHTLGVNINIEDYCKYINENEDILRKEDGVIMASVLDGIGSDKLTFENQMRMEKLGATPLPCFHFGEDPEYLKYYVKNYSYITLGGLVPVSSKAAEIWLDEIWEKYLTDGAGNPLLKVHGFGVTTISLMERYPWFSCDSSSWIQAAAFGSVVSYERGAMPISSQSNAVKTKGRHFFTLTEEEQYNIACEWYKEGFGPHRLSHIYESRAVCNMLGYMNMQDIINENKLNLDFSVPVGLF